MEAARRVGSWRATGRGTRSAGSARWRPGSWRTASTAPEPERPHHRRRRKRRHERREDMEDGEISEDQRRSRNNDDFDQSGAPASSSAQFPGSGPQISSVDRGGVNAILINRIKEVLMIFLKTVLNH